jgi:hypothetical protein
MSEKTTSITEAIQSGQDISPAVYQMWIEDLMQERNILVEALKKERSDAQVWGIDFTVAQINKVLELVGELP